MFSIEICGTLAIMQMLSYSQVLNRGIKRLWYHPPLPRRLTTLDHGLLCEVLSQKVKKVEEEVLA